MTRKKYLKRMKQHERSFDLLWWKIADETNDFLKDNPETSIHNLNDGNRIEKFSDYLALSGAWIQDRINGKFPKDRGALTKKIRKALGYTYP